jgi:hypothetical protein
MIGRLVAVGLVACLAAAATAAWAADSHGVAGNACSLISADEVSAIIGAKVAAADREDTGTTRDGAWSSTCLWKLAGGPRSSDPSAPFGGVGFAMLNTITWPGGPDAARKYLEDFRDAARNDLIDMAPVPVHAGDEALWWGDGVAVRKGAVSFGVSVHTGTDKTAERTMEEALARIVAERL